MTQRIENPELGLSVRLDLTFGDLRILPSDDAPDRIVITAGNGDVAVSIPADDAIHLANMITDAVDQLDGRRQS